MEDMKFSKSCRNKSDLLGDKQKFNINHPVIIMEYLNMIKLQSLKSN